MPSSTAFTRRGFVTVTASAAGAIAALPLLSACGTASSASGATTKQAAKSVLPTYKPSTAVAADIPSAPGANGAASDPAFLSFPANPAKSVSGAVGSGGSYKAITPLWGAAPPKGNSYYSTVNAAIGATVDESPSDGNNYGTMLATLFASGDVPDWLDVPSWNVPAIQDFAEGVQKYFKDLTPYLAGDKVLEYPNLAAIPSGGWQAGVWNGKLYGIPLWTSAGAFGGTIFYRADIFKSLGINADSVTSADAFKALGAELTDKAKGRYAFDDLNTYYYGMFKIPTVASAVGWKYDSSGKLVSGYETPEFIEMLNFANSISKSGWVHPNAIAGDSSDAKNRFWAGKTVITGDGTGAWNKADALSGKAANPTYERQGFKPFAYDGGTPTVPLNAGAGMFSYLNKNLKDSQVKEILRIANYFAAPFGSAEYLTVRYGKEDVDYTMTASGPLLTAEGNKVVTDTFDQLANCQSVVFNPGYDQLTKDFAAWQAAMVKHAYNPLFTGMNFSEPSDAAKGTTALESVITDVRLGRKTISDYQNALSTWKNVSGNELRSFFEGIAKQYGTGA